MKAVISRSDETTGGLEPQAALRETASNAYGKSGGSPRSPLNGPETYRMIYALEHPGTLEVLLLLDEEGKTNPYRMRRRLPPGQRAIDHALQTLVSTGLVRSAKSTTFPFAGVYELTGRGKRMAQTMRTWATILIE
jgi:DNA-binding HxlR family transcriptional regulator